MFSYTLSAALMLGLLSSLAIADLTVSLSDVKPLPYDFSKSVTSAADLLNQSCPEEFSLSNPYPPPELLMSSFDQGSIPNGTIFPSSDGLVRGAIEAWAQHQHLVLRPEEVWFEILAQLNFYMTAHAEDLRNLFVSHSGKEEIVVKEWSWRAVIAAFSKEIQKRVKTPWLRDWILPTFTTSTDNDKLTATVLMMGLMKHYFNFSGGILCGLPAVTLLGQRQDWVKLLGKLDRLKEFGKEPAQYADELRPILKRFVQTWDEPSSPDTRNFWDQIVRTKRLAVCGAGPLDFDVTGWITGFFKWRTNGQLRVHPTYEIPKDRLSSYIQLDKIAYIPVPLDELPVGYAKAPLKMLDYPTPGQNTMAYLLAGNVAVKRTKPKKEGYIKAQPLSAWFMYAPVDSNYTIPSPYGQYSELRGIASSFKLCSAE